MAVSTLSSSAVEAVAPKGLSESKASEQKMDAKSFSRVELDIWNSVLPLERLKASTPSQLDGLTAETEAQIRSLGCDLIQIAGKLLRLPQVSMATACVLFQRFYYAKSLLRSPFEHVAMASLVLASKIEESPRRTRDVINVFRHIRQVRSGKPIVPLVLDQHYIALKNNVIKAERRILKELGFCVHVKHPHKIIVIYLRWLEHDDNLPLLQMSCGEDRQTCVMAETKSSSWLNRNFMNDGLRTDIFVRYPPETIAVACIYLSARKLRIPLPNNPAWYHVLDVAEEDIISCCHRMITLYNMKKPNQDELEAVVRQLDESRRAAKTTHSATATSRNTPVHSNPSSRMASPNRGHGQDRRADVREVLTKLASSNHNDKNGDSRKDERRSSSTAIRSSRHGSRDDSERRRNKSKKQRRSRSRSSSYDRKRSKKDHYRHKSDSRRSSDHRRSSKSSSSGKRR